MDQPSTPPTRKLNIELLLGLSATFLSLAALIVSVLQTKIAREQQHASVWPYLSEMNSSEIGTYHYGIENKGVGPAIIRKVDWQYDTAFYDGAREFIWKQIGMNKVGIGFGGIRSGFVLKSGDPIELIGVYENDSLSRKVAEKVESHLFNLRVVYADVYGNCWELNNGKTTQLSDCPQ